MTNAGPYGTRVVSRRCDRLPGEAEGERVRSLPRRRRREAPSANRADDACLGIRRAGARPRPTGHVRPPHGAAFGDVDRNGDRAREVRVHLEPILLIAEAKLGLTAADVGSEFVDVAAGLERLDADRRGRRNTHRRTDDAAATANATDAATTAATGTRTAADPTASRGRRALAALSTAEHHLASRTAAAASTESAARAAGA